MLTETLSELSHETINILQGLIRANLDSRDGLMEAAEHIHIEHVSALLHEAAAQRHAQAVELQAIVAANHEHPRATGSVAAAVHRRWIDLRSALGGGVYAMLCEAERGEDYIVGAYEEAIDKVDGSLTVLRRHYDAVLAIHNRIRQLRDQHGA